MKYYHVCDGFKMDRMYYKWREEQSYQPYTYDWYTVTWGLIHMLGRLAEEHEIPDYPKDVTDYAIRGQSLGNWMKCFKSMVNGDDKEIYTLIWDVEESDGEDVLPCLYQIYRELIMNPEEVTDKIRKQKAMEKDENIFR